MAAAAIQSILPSGMQNPLESKVSRQSPPTNSEEKEREKRCVPNFDAKKRRRSPDETVESSRSQRLGESSPQLQLKDFELLKTIGTGMGHYQWGYSIGLTKVSQGTFARVWLSRLANPVGDEDRGRVFALKIIRKVDSE